MTVLSVVVPSWNARELLRACLPTRSRSRRRCRRRPRCSSSTTGVATAPRAWCTSDSSGCGSSATRGTRATRTPATKARSSRAARTSASCTRTSSSRPTRCAASSRSSRRTRSTAPSRRASSTPRARRCAAVPKPAHAALPGHAVRALVPGQFRARAPRRRRLRLRARRRRPARVGRLSPHAAEGAEDDAAVRRGAVALLRRRGPVSTPLEARVARRLPRGRVRAPAGGMSTRFYLEAEAEWQRPARVLPQALRQVVGRVGEAVVAWTFLDHCVRECWRRAHGAVEKPLLPLWQDFELFLRR